MMRIIEVFVVFGFVTFIALAICLIPNGPKIIITSPETRVEPSGKALAVTTWESLGFFEVTAYCPCEKCCGKYVDGITASGYVIQYGDRFVAAPKMIPFGTEIIVGGYNNNKPVKVLDRGGAIKVGVLDVYFDSHQKALEWGRQFHVEVWDKNEEE